MFTVADIIHLIQYYYDTSSYNDAAADVEHFQLESLRGVYPFFRCPTVKLIASPLWYAIEIERALKVPPPPLLYIHPLRPLYEACQYLIQTHARRLPLLDRDEQTGDEVVLSVLTQYRVLKFIAINCREISHLHMSLRSLGIGTYVQPSADHPENPFWPIKTATLDTTVFDVVHMFSKDGISAVPIVDKDGTVINMYETVDVITLVRLGAYQSLDLTISAALSQRSPDFPGVITCTPQDSLASLMLLIKQRRVHRLVVVEGDADSKGRDRGRGEWTERDRSVVRGESLERSPPTASNTTPAAQKSNKMRLVGIITLSDVLKYLVGKVDHSILSGGIGNDSWGSDDGESQGVPAEGLGEGFEGMPGLGNLGIRGESSSRDRYRPPNGETPTGSGIVTPQTNITTPALSTPNDEAPPQA
ncbi:AMP-activated serine/threonine-protein kinase regulatory subunit [Tulasnella sp. 403]|nr:AMP-activated serine/threonine-protein kinase regulatory subunit [Tulasnella sp. 403]